MLIVVAEDEPTTYRCVGTFTTCAGVIEHITPNMRKKQPFEEAIYAVKAVGDYCCVGVEGVTYHVTAVHTDGRARTIYIDLSGKAYTAKPKSVAVVLKPCQNCGDWCKPVVDDKFCSTDCVLRD